MLHLLKTVETLDRRGVGVKSLRGHHDQPQGWITMQVPGATAELERALIREPTVAGLDYARSQGRVGAWTGGGLIRVARRLVKDRLAVVGHSHRIVSQM